MNRLHLGRGTSSGALTVFPVWGEYAGARGYRDDATAMSVSELEAGPTVASLTATNASSQPLLLLEGLLLEGGWQNRLVARSVLVPAHAAVALDVLCVEAGRWNGGLEHRWKDRRVSLRVRSVLSSGRDHQGEVWSRVDEYEARHGPSETKSLVDHADRVAAGVDVLVQGLRPLAGQVGVVLGVAGQPVLAEVFDSPTTLQHHFRSIIAAAALDCVGQEETATPSRRARRFLDRASGVRRTAVASAGLGTTLAGADAYATVSALAWRRRDVHLVAVNPRHSLSVMSSQ